MYRSFVKLIIDFFAALFGILILSPILLFLVISLFILNNGKPFFYQARTGKNGRIFTIIKFKTMNDKTDLDGNLLPALERVTSVGNLCRKLSLDELPQLLNVLKGDMSLIGPRPLLPQYLSRYNERQSRRHEVLPGITGWAQVNGRNAISWEQKFDYDVFYVDHQSFVLDFLIILKTINKVIYRKDINSSESVNMSEFQGSKNS
ncbi:sugar transferase [Gelidibacter sp.]|uniref:sugar transferase n=1 Tax=Gelidibacter sp. TaxID=2018083 RepID=UPI0032679816